MSSDDPATTRRAPQDPFEPTAQLRREVGIYSPPDDGRFGAGHDRNTLARLRSREQELNESHWRTFVCPRGHVIEGHRRAGGTALTFRCPVCGAVAPNEPSALTALREHRAQNTALAQLSRAFDAMSEWAQQHLDAKNWTVRSEMQRKAAMLSGGDRQERHSADQLKSPFLR